MQHSEKRSYLTNNAIGIDQKLLQIFPCAYIINSRLTIIINLLPASGNNISKRLTRSLKKEFVLEIKKMELESLP